MRHSRTERRHGPRAEEWWANRGPWGRRPAAPLRAEALRARRRTPVSLALTPQAGGAGRNAADDGAAYLTGPSSSRRASSRRAKITVKGAPEGRVPSGRPLTVIFHGKTSAPIGRTDQPRLFLLHSCQRNSTLGLRRRRAMGHRGGKDLPGLGPARLTGGRSCAEPSTAAAAAGPRSAATKCQGSGPGDHSHIAHASASSWRVYVGASSPGPGSA